MFSSLQPVRPGTEPLAAAVRACRTHLIGAAVFSALVNVLYLTPTLYMMQVYDRVVPTGGITTLVLLSAVTIFALATLAGLDWLRTRLLIRGSLELDAQLAPRILSRVVDATGRPAGSQALREFDHVRSALGGQGALALFDAPWTPLYLGACFLLHPAIGALTLVGGCILFGLAWANEKDNRSKLKSAMSSASGAYALQEGFAAHAETVRALGMRGSSIALQTEQRQVAIHQQVDSQFTGGRYSGAIKFVRLALQSIALGLSGFLVVKGQMSAGSIIASSVLLSRAVSPIEQLVGAWPALVQAKTSWSALTELFADTAEQDRPRTSLPDPTGKLQLEGVTLIPPGAQSPTLRNASLTVEPGQTVGIIGPSGSGKTTLARIIAGGLKPTAGTVRLDGSEYGARDSDQLARHIGYLPQSPTLFPGSIRDNICRFAGALKEDKDAVDREVMSAALGAGVHEMIQRLPNGYDTQLGPNGAGISAGQAQRVAFARALYGDPVLLVLDEPNSSLDQEGETALMDGISGATSRGASVLIVAHRAGILARVDRLIAMRSGTIQLEGMRDEVLAKMRPAGAPRAAAVQRTSVQ